MWKATTRTTRYTPTPRAEMINKVINWFDWNVFGGSQSVIPIYIYKG
jgi:hypothetical protein